MTKFQKNHKNLGKKLYYVTLAKYTVIIKMCAYWHLKISNLLGLNQKRININKNNNKFASFLNTEMKY